MQTRIPAEPLGSVDGPQAARASARTRATTRHKAPGRLPGLEPFAGSTSSHQQTEALFRRVGILDANDLPLVHHGDAITERPNFVEFGRDEQDGGALVALRDQTPVNELDRADVDAPGPL